MAQLSRIYRTFSLFSKPLLSVSDIAREHICTVSGCSPTVIKLKLLLGKVVNAETGPRLQLEDSHRLPISPSAAAIPTG